MKLIYGRILLAMSFTLVSAYAAAQDDSSQRGGYSTNETKGNEGPGTSSGPKPPGYHTTGVKPPCKGKECGGTGYGGTTGHGGSTTGWSTGNYTGGNHTTGKPTTGGPYTSGGSHTTDTSHTTCKPTTGPFTTGHQTTGYPTTGRPTTGSYTTGHATTGYPTTGRQTTVLPTTTGPTTGITTVDPTTGIQTTVLPTTTGPTTTVLPTTTGPTTGTQTTVVETTVTPTTGTPTTGTQTTGNQTTVIETTVTPTVTTTETPTTSTATSTATTVATSTSGESTTTGASTSSTSSTGESSTSSTTTTDSTATSSTTGKDEKKKKLRSKLEPLFHLSFDYGSYIINLTPFDNNPKSEDSNSDNSLVKYDYQPSGDTMIAGDYRDGFQRTVYGSLEVGLGAQVHFWYDHAHGLADEFWAYVGVLPLIGRDVSSVRYAKDLGTAQRMGGRWSIPGNASDLDRWDEGDSITYQGHGGILFSATAGFGSVGAGVAKLAAGTWEVYVEKVGTNRAYVKMSNGKLSSLSMFTNVTILTLSLNEFKNSDDGFSYLFDLSTETGRKAYEDMIRGNVIASEDLATKPVNLVELPPVTKVETFRTVSTGKIVSKSLSIPIIWDQVYSTGRINSFTTSDLHIDRNTTRVNYGIYSSSEDSRWWLKHADKDFMFYGAAYSVENWDTKEVMKSMFGTYAFAYRNEHSDEGQLRMVLRDLVKHTGAERLMVKVPDIGKGYTGIEFNVSFPEENTMRLMMLAQRMDETQFQRYGVGYIDSYMANDPYYYCAGEVNRIAHSSCISDLKSNTRKKMSKMYYALRKMMRYVDTDPKAFAAAYGEFGEGMAENMFTFKAALRLAGGGVTVDYLIEGTYLSMYRKQWTIDSDGAWVPMEDSTHQGLPWNPKTRHSMVRGIIIGNSEAGKIPHLSPVEL